MAEQIDGLLFSPVNAGSLSRGDLIRGMNKTLRVGSHPEQWQKNGIHYVVLHGKGPDGEPWELTFRINRPVPRAVGARTGGTI